jgi:type IV secretion system pilin
MIRLTALLAADAGMARIVSILDGIRNALVAVLATLAIVSLTYAGVRYVLAGGDPSGVEKAKGATRSALIGLALALLAPVVVAIVKGIINA